MSRFIISGFQSLVYRIVSYASRNVRYMMAASGYSSQNDVQDDTEKDAADDPHRMSDSDKTEPHTELTNGNSATGSPTKPDTDNDAVDCGSSVEKRQSSSSFSPRTMVLGQERDCSPSGVLFTKDQPKRQFHFGLWSNSDTGYVTREQTIKAEKGKQTSFKFNFACSVENLLLLLLAMMLMSVFESDDLGNIYQILRNQEPVITHHG